jgi:hypothetical protein
MSADLGRTFVVGDCHGYPELIINALRDMRLHYGTMRAGTDRLVFAGDFLDRGPYKGARQCLALIEALADRGRSGGCSPRPETCC